MSKWNVKTYFPQVFSGHQALNVELSCHVPAVGRQQKWLLHRQRVRHKAGEGIEPGSFYETASGLTRGSNFGGNPSSIDTKSRLLSRNPVILMVGASVKYS